MPGEVWAEKLPPKKWNKFDVAIFCLVGLDNLAHGVKLVS